MFLNGRGQAAMGQGSGPGSVDGRVVADPGGGICWVSDDQVILQTLIGGVWTAVLVDIHTNAVAVPAPARPANTLVGGGGRWAAFIASSPSLVYGALGELPGAALYAAGPDGTIAWKRSYQAPSGLTLTLPAGGTIDLPEALPLDVQVVGPGQAVWLEPAGLRAFNVPVPRPALPSGRMRVADVAGERWLVYWSEGTGLVAQVDGASDGYVLEPQPVAFNHDARGVNGELVVAWSRTQGEAPGDLVKVTVNRSQPRVALVQPPVEKPEPPDPPKPPELPEPPHPKPPKPLPIPLPGPFPAAHGVVMPSPIRVALRLGQYFASIDPNAVLKADGYRYDDLGRGPFKGWYPVRFRKDSLPLDENCAFVLSQPKPGDPKLLIRPELLVDQGVAMSADATEFSGDISSEFGAKPDVSDAAWGGYEAWNGWTLDNGIRIVLVEYDRDGARYTSACLTVVAL